MTILAVFGLFANKSDDLKVIGNFFVGVLNPRFLTTSSFYRVGDSNQKVTAADHPLESHGESEDHTVSLSKKIATNTSSLYSPSLAKLRLNLHPCK